MTECKTEYCVAMYAPRIVNIHLIWNVLETVYFPWFSPVWSWLAQWYLLWWNTTASQGRPSRHFLPFGLFHEICYGSAINLTKTINGYRLNPTSAKTGQVFKWKRTMVYSQVYIHPNVLFSRLYFNHQFRLILHKKKISQTVGLLSFVTCLHTWYILKWCRFPKPFLLIGC